jgi:hypothetical protein
MELCIYACHGALAVLVLAAALHTDPTPPAHTTPSSLSAAQPPQRKDTTHPRGARARGGNFSCSACGCGSRVYCCSLVYPCLGGRVRCSQERLQHSCPAQGCCCREGAENRPALQRSACASAATWCLTRHLAVAQAATSVDRGSTASHGYNSLAPTAPTGPVRSALLQSRHLAAPGTSR